MPNIKSAIKRVRVAEANHMRNKSVNTALKTALKKADTALTENADNKAECVKVAVKKLDQAATKGLIHKNNAARKKSALVIRLNKTNA